MTTDHYFKQAIRGKLFAVAPNMKLAINSDPSLEIQQCLVDCCGHLVTPVLRILLLMKLECGPMPIVMAALPNIDGALCSTSQSLADTHY